MPRTYFASNPTYVVIAGDVNTNVADIEAAVKGIFTSIRNSGRNPVMFGVQDNATSMVAATIAAEQRVPLAMGSVAGLFHNLAGRRLNPSNVQVVLFQTPEYAGSQECFDILTNTKAVNGTLRNWSNHHHLWLNSSKVKNWVLDFNAKFIKTLNSYSLSVNEKQNLFRDRMTKLQKYSATALLKAEPKANAEPTVIPASVLSNAEPFVPVIPEAVGIAG